MIAEACGVSQATVSRVLNHDTTLNVTKEVRETIEAKAKTLDYLPPRLRRRIELPYTIAFATTLAFRPSQETVILSRLNEAGKTFGMRFIPSTAALSCDGVVLLGNFTDAEIEAFRRLSAHLLVINKDKKDYSYDRIIMDYDDAEEQVWNYFTAMHCSDIGYFGGLYQSGGVVIGRRRMEFFVQLLQKNGLYNPKNIHTGTMDALSGYQTVKHADTIPQGILFGDGAFATGGFKALAERGEHPLCVVYQDLEPYQGHEADAVVRIFTDAVWQNACRFLEQQIRGERDTAFAVQVPAKLEIFHHEESVV